jgi:hypothetical protein
MASPTPLTTSAQRNTAPHPPGTSQRAQLLVSESPRAAGVPQAGPALLVGSIASPEPPRKGAEEPEPTLEQCIGTLTSGYTEVLKLLMSGHPEGLSRLGGLIDSIEKAKIQILSAGQIERIRECLDSTWDSVVQNDSNNVFAILRSLNLAQAAGHSGGELDSLRKAVELHLREPMGDLVGALYLIGNGERDPEPATLTRLNLDGPTAELLGLEVVKVLSRPRDDEQAQLNYLRIIQTGTHKWLRKHSDSRNPLIGPIQKIDLCLQDQLCRSPNFEADADAAAVPVAASPANVPMDVQLRREFNALDRTYADNVKRCVRLFDRWQLADDIAKGGESRKERLLALGVAWRLRDQLQSVEALLAMLGNSRAQLERVWREKVIGQEVPPLQCPRYPVLQGLDWRDFNREAVPPTRAVAWLTEDVQFQRNKLSGFDEKDLCRWTDGSSRIDLETWKKKPPLPARAELIESETWINAARAWSDLMDAAERLRRPGANAQELDRIRMQHDAMRAAWAIDLVPKAP